MARVSASGKLNIMLVEDHSLFRDALAFVLAREPDLEVVAKAGSPRPGRRSGGGASTWRWST